MKRTSFNIDRELLQAIAQLAAEQGTSQTNLIALFLAEGLKRARTKVSAKTEFKLPTFGTGGLQPGIDLRNRSALMDAIDDTEL